MGGCEDEQVAAWTNQSHKNSGFRLQMTAARLFGLFESTSGRHRLGELGPMIIDPQRTREARVRAFLQVPLYSAVFEKYLAATARALNERGRQLRRLTGPLIPGVPCARPACPIGRLCAGVPRVQFGLRYCRRRAGIARRSCGTVPNSAFGRDNTNSPCTRKFWKFIRPVDIIYVRNLLCRHICGCRTQNGARAKN
jgi:hypothetical protein